VRPSNLIFSPSFVVALEVQLEGSRRYQFARHTIKYDSESIDMVSVPLPHTVSLPMTGNVELAKRTRLDECASAQYARQRSFATDLFCPDTLFLVELSHKGTHVTTCFGKPADESSGRVYLHHLASPTCDLESMFHHGSFSATMSAWNNGRTTYAFTSGNLWWWNPLRLWHPQTNSRRPICTLGWMLGERSML